MNQIDPPELTIKAVLLGILLAIVLAGANAYLGLFAGMTVSASIPAAVISMGILALFKNTNILENNMVQTAASAGESIAAGVIFTLPALVIMGYWQVFDYWWVSLIAGLGGLLGVMFSIPLRRTLIVEEGLVFPEGTATAEVLKVGNKGGTGITYLAWAALIGAIVKFCETGLRFWSATVESASQIGNSMFYFGSNLSPALLSVGYIVRLNIAVLVFIGGAISWFVAIPLFLGTHHDSDSTLKEMLSSQTPMLDIAWYIWSTKIRYLGVGGMLVGGIWALISMWPAIFRGISDGIQQYRNPMSASHKASNRMDQDLPMPIILVSIAIFVIPIFFLYQQIVATVSVSIPMTLIMVVAGFLFSAVAAYMAGLVGSSNNPISGVTIATILLASLLLLLLMGSRAENGAAAAIMIGAVVCSAAAISGDNMQDLKTGFILNATPWKQQVMQFVGVISAVLVMAPILTLLLKAYGFGAATAEQPDALSAPQATLMASVAQGVFGNGLPWGMIALGALIGIMIIIIDHRLEKSDSHWRAPVLAVAVGMYLPLELAVPIFFGGLIAHFAHGSSAQQSDESDPKRRHGILFAAGLITGEALIGIFLAIPIVLTGDREVLALASEPLGGIPGLLVMIALIIVLYRITCRTKQQQ